MITFITDQLASTRQVAEYCGVGHHTVLKWIKRHGLEPEVRGESSGKSGHLWNLDNVRLWAIRTGRWDQATDRPLQKR